MAVKADTKEIRFAFGRNWSDFIKKSFSDERVNISQKHILKFLGMDSLEGKIFLDIGCGSGLHSLAAFRAKAARIFSFDYDIESVHTTSLLKEMAGSPASWTVVQGSVLDKEFMSSIEEADIVYSWGVLHHTGAMWQAIENASKRVKPDGKFYIALYDPTHMVPSVEYWVRKKIEYNKRSNIGKYIMEFWYIWRYIMGYNIFNLGKYLKMKRDYQVSGGRGMSMHTDIRDWLGGMPFEYATPAEVETFCSEKLGMRLVKSSCGHACAEYLFVRS